MTTPGIPIGGFVIPITFDAYTNLSLTQSTCAVFVSTLGVADLGGRGSAAVALPSALDPSLAGLALHHTALAFEPSDLTLVGVTEAVRLTLLP